jgi:putative solute:sodium symporter small subunit
VCPGAIALGNGGAAVASNAHGSDAAEPRGRARRFPYLALLGWLLFALVIPYFVQSLNVVDVQAFPLGFFMAAQGSLIGLLVVAVVSARHRDRIAASVDR